MNVAIIVAAGKSTRMGRDLDEIAIKEKGRTYREYGPPDAKTPVDKIKVEIAGKPIVAHTWLHFDSAKCIDEIILVIRHGKKPLFVKMAKDFRVKKPFKFVLGGAERQDSVWNGLEALPRNAEIVAIQDAARPCTSEEIIEQTVKVAKKFGAAVAARPMIDTLKESSDGKTILHTMMPRDRYWSVQTPQTFRVEIIRSALIAARGGNHTFTDDTAACELIKQEVHLVPNFAPNPKVTVADDLPFVEALLEFEQKTKSLKD